jgi:hypothetical protein
LSVTPIFRLIIGLETYGDLLANNLQPSRIDLSQVGVLNIGNH